MEQIHATTKMVMDALPDEEKAFWKDAGKYFLPGHNGSNSSFFPDCYVPHSAPENQKMVAPYALEIMGLPFHNFPVAMETTEGTGSWQTNTERNWRFIMDGFHYYLSAVVRSMKAGEIKHASGFLNWLCHVLQDQSSFMHSLQGPAGVQPLIFSEFFPPPEGMPHKNASFFLTETCPSVQLKGYKPLVLGTSIPEAAFHLYHRYRQVNRHTRWNLIPLIQSSYESDKSKETEIRKAIATKVAELIFDVFHTVFCLAKGQFPDEETSILNTVDITDLFPIEYPNNLSGPYRFCPMVKGACLRDAEEPVPVPLQLSLKNGDKRERVSFDSGFGTGTHYEYVMSFGIPKDVYQRVQLAVGLHAELGQKGRIEVKIHLDEKILFQKEFVGSSEGERVEADVTRGGILRWTVCGSMDKSNHVVWGEPVLLKNKSS